MGKLAPHSETQCSIPEINGPAVQQEFTFLLRETCNPGLLATTGLAASNGALRREQESAEAIVPRATSRKNETGRTHNSRRAEPGRQTRPSLVLGRSDEADRPSYRTAISVAETECCSVRKDC